MWLFLSHPPPPNTHLHTHAYYDKYPVTCLCEHGTEGSTPSPWGWQGSGLWDSSLDLSFTSSNSLAVRRKHLSRITTAVAPFLYVCSQGFAEINISCDSVWWMCTRNSEVKGYTQTVLTYIQTRRQDLNDSIPMETWLVVWKLNRKGQVISFWGDSEGWNAHYCTRTTREVAITDTKQHNIPMIHQHIRWHNHHVRDLLRELEGVWDL